MNAKALDNKFDDGKVDIIDDLDLSAVNHPNQTQRQVNVDFPAFGGRQMDNMQLQSFLESQGYTDFKTSSDGTLYCLLRLIFTHGIFCRVDRDGYAYRYCYHTLLEARGALNDWAANDFSGEPEGFITRKP